MQKCTFMQLNATERKKLIMIILEDSAFKRMDETETMIKDVLDNIHFPIHNKTIEIKCGSRSGMHYEIEILKERMKNIEFIKKE